MNKKLKLTCSLPEFSKDTKMSVKNPVPVYAHHSEVGFAEINKECTNAEITLDPDLNLHNPNYKKIVETIKKLTEKQIVSMGIGGTINKDKTKLTIHEVSFIPLETSKNIKKEK